MPDSDELKTFSVMYVSEIPLWSVMEWTDTNHEWFLKDILPLPTGVKFNIQASSASEALQAAEQIMVERNGR